MGEAFSTHGRGEKSVQGFGESPKERDHLKDQGVGENGIRMDLREIGLGGVNWI
jgi:hypothetical protein